MDIRVKDIIRDNSIWIPSCSYNIKKPKLSIIMPTYGKAKDGFFKRAVTSYLEQTFRDTELIIIDDANIDGTSEQIDELMKKDDRISCIRHKKNMKIPVISMYEALKVARGEYIGFLFDNCVLYPSAYERSLKKMKSEGADASYGRVLLYSSVDNTEKKYETQVYYNEKNLDNLESSNFIRNVSIILKKSIIDTIGFLDPHMCLYKVSDWDFITRIKRKFYLIDTGVLFSKEYNPNEESDNSVNFSIVEEYYKISDREKKLSLNNYEKINIFSKEENSSYSFILELKKIFENFKDKYWMIPNNNFEKEISFFEDNIVVHCNNFISASSTLIFNKNSSDMNQSIFSYMCTDKNIAKSRAVILVRETNMSSSLLKKLRYAKIPAYLLWDDDFLLLAKEKVFDLNITENSFRKAANQFHGLIFTSDYFHKTYEGKKYNKYNYLLNPIYLDGLEKKISVIENNKLNIAFTGGIWRIINFKEILIRILNNIKRNTNVNLYLPRNKSLETFFGENKIDFSVFWYDTTLSYDQLINKLGDKDIQILIHPAQQNNNNKNKTKNALVTASLLGAALVTTDEAPYNMKDSEDDPMPYLLVPNEEKHWIEAIKELLDDEIRSNMIKIARDYCRKKYSAKCLDKLIQDVKQNTPKVDFELYSERLEKLSYFSGKLHDKAINNQDIDGIGENIIATKKIDKKLKTYFISDKKNFSTIAIIFGTHNKKISGTCKIKIYDEENNQIYNDTMHLEKIIDNVFYNIHIDYIENTMGKKFYITFDFNYENNKNKISVYERNYKYSGNKIIRNLIRPFRINEIYVALS